MERQLGEGNVTNGEHVIKSTSAGLQCQRPEQEPLDKLTSRQFGFQLGFECEFRFGYFLPGDSCRCACADNE